MLERISLIFIFLLLIISYNHAQDAQFEWAKGMGGTNTDGGNTTITDILGNVYVVGSFISTVDFDPNNNIEILSSKGKSDIFILKLNAKGEYQWAKTIGGSGFDSGTSISTDADGNVYITGSFYGTVDFDPGEESKELTSKGKSDVFILKIDFNGNFKWVTVMGGKDLDVGQSISIDTLGDVYVVGNFYDTLTFDSGLGIEDLIAKGITDIFVLKLDANGNIKWAKSVGGNYWDTGTSISTDNESNVYLTGSFGDTADFNPSKVEQEIVTGNIFVLKLDSNGNYKWVKVISGVINGEYIGTDTKGNVYVIGLFGGTVDLDPGIETKETIVEKIAIFVLKIDNNGNYVWSKNIDGADQLEVRNCVIDVVGNVYLTGIFKGIVDFDPGTDTNIITTNASPIYMHDSYIWKLDKNGDLQWVKDIEENIDMEALAVDAGGNLYLTGYFNETVDFDPGEDSCKFTSNGGNDIFVVKFSQCNIDIQVNQVGNTYIANAEGMQKYRWYNADSKEILSSTNEFIPSENGNYILSIENFGCYAYSDTIKVHTLGINDNLFNKGIRIYPNPTTGNFKLSFEGLQNRLQISVKNIAGKVIQQVSAENTQLVSLDLDGNKGVYFVEIRSEEQIAVVKVVVL